MAIIHDNKNIDLLKLNQIRADLLRRAVYECTGRHLDDHQILRQCHMTHNKGATRYTYGGQLVLTIRDPHMADTGNGEIVMTMSYTIWS